MATGIDLLSFDRDVRRAAQALARARLALANDVRAGIGGEAEDARRWPNPFDLEAKEQRHVAGQTSYRALVALEPPAHERQLLDALARWSYEFLQARVGWELEVEDARRIHAVDPRLSRRAARAAEPGAVPSSDRKHVAVSFADAWRDLVVADHPARRDEAMTRLADLAGPVAAVRRERRERRDEVARRLAVEPSPFALVVPGGVAPLVASARQLLDATEPLARELLREAKRDLPGAWSLAHAIDWASAREATEGWPAHLSLRWLSEAFKGIATRESSEEARLDRSARLPEVLSAASFLRAAFAFGYGFRLAGTARSLPFALSRDPYPVDAYELGAVFATALAEPVFQRRRLGLSARVALAQSRALRRSLFVAMRVGAARLVLMTSSGNERELFEETTTRAFGAPMASSLVGAWPEPRIDEPARFSGLLGAASLHAELVRRFDEDWFENPNAGRHLAARASAPIRADLEAVDAKDAGDSGDDAARVAVLARSFEEALG